MCDACEYRAALSMCEEIMEVQPGNDDIGALWDRVQDRLHVDPAEAEALYQAYREVFEV